MMSNDGEKQLNSDGDPTDEVTAGAGTDQPRRQADGTKRLRKPSSPAKKAPQSATERSARLNGKWTFAAAVVGGLALVASAVIQRWPTARAEPVKPQATSQEKMGEVRSLMRPSKWDFVTRRTVKDLLRGGATPSSEYDKGLVAVGSGSYEEAKAIADKGLREKSMPASMANRLRSIAEFAQGSFTGARESMEKVFHEAPGSVEAIEDLGFTWYYDGHPELAEPLLKDALSKRIGEVFFSEPTAETMSNYAVSILARTEESEKLLWEALSIYSISQRKPSYQQAGVIANIGSIWAGRLEYGEAKLLYLQAIKMSEGLPEQKRDDEALGTFHNNLGECFEQLGDKESARQNFRSALTIRERVLPAGHPHISETLRKLSHLEEPSVAVDMCYRAVQMDEETFGADTVGVGMAYLDYAEVLRLTSDRVKAGSYFGRVGNICKALPAEHPLSKEFRRLTSK